MQEQFIIIAIVAFICFCIYSYFTSDSYKLKCIISKVDGNTYCIRDRKKMHLAVDRLAEAVNNCKKLVIYMHSTYPDDERVKRLVEGFNPDKISETLPTSTLTAYSENKGEKMAFCLNREKHDNERIIDVHTLTFVAFHELSHIMTLSVGHYSEFWKNFKFILECGKNSGIHEPANYKKEPKQFCGMSVTDSPFFDL